MSTAHDLHHPDLIRTLSPSEQSERADFLASLLTTAERDARSKASAAQSIYASGQRDGGSYVASDPRTVPVHPLSLPMASGPGPIHGPWMVRPHANPGPLATLAASLRMARDVAPVPLWSRMVRPLPVVRADDKTGAVRSRGTIVPPEAPDLSPIASLGYALQAGSLAFFSLYGDAHGVAKAKATASRERARGRAKSEGNRVLVDRDGRRVRADDAAWCHECGAVRGRAVRTPSNMGAGGLVPDQTIRVIISPDGETPVRYATLSAWSLRVVFSPDAKRDRSGNPVTWFAPAYLSPSDRENAATCLHGAKRGVLLPILAASGASPAIMTSGRYATRSDAARVHSPISAGRIYHADPSRLVMLPTPGGFTIPVPVVRSLLANGTVAKVGNVKGGRPVGKATAEAKANKAKAKRAAAIAAVMGADAVGASDL